MYRVAFEYEPPRLPPVAENPGCQSLLEQLDVDGATRRSPRRCPPRTRGTIALPLLDGTAVSVDGSTVSAHIGLSTPRAGRVPVLLAAMAPRMLNLAGEQTDRTVLWMTGPATVRDYVVPAISAAAAAAGRPSPRVVCILPVCVTSDPAAARASAAAEFAVYGQLPSYRAMLDREGAAGPGDVAIVGDEDAVAAQIAALADAGVTDFLAAEFARGEDRERTRSLLKAVIAGS